MNACTTFPMAALILFATSVAGASGQAPIRLDLLPPLGTEVRADVRTDAGQGRVQGTLIRAVPEAITLERRDRVRRVLSSEAVVGLQVRGEQDHRRGFWKGLGIGALVGGIALGSYVAIAAHADRGSSDCWIACGSGEGFAIGATAGAIIGAPLGGGVGAIVGSQRWEPVW